MPSEHRFEDAAACAAALASYVSQSIQSAIAEHGEASLIFSGGRTPLRLFERLHSAPLDWPRVKASLADERWVSADDPSSNEGFVRRHLLRGEAAALQFIGLKTAAATAGAGAAAAWSRLSAMRRPFDAVLLGIGDDGHTASLFPDSPGLSAALDAQAAPGCVAMRAPVAPQERLTLNLPALLETRSIVLLISGADKWQVYERARDGSDIAAMPVRALLRQTRIPVDVYGSA